MTPRILSFAADPVGTAMDGATPDLALFPILAGLAGGLALFLFGLEKMTGALKIVAGSRMKALLARLTTNRFKALFAGAFVAAIAHLTPA